MATGKDLRRIALSLAGTLAAPHFDRTAFKVARTYVTLSADGCSCELQIHARRAGAQMHDGAGSLHPAAEQMGPEGLDGGKPVQAQQRRSQSRARDGLAARAAEEAEAAVSRRMALPRAKTQAW